MVRLVTAIFLLAPALSFAQHSPAPQEDKNLTLQQRYVGLKLKSETYQEFKVIKEYSLDGVWKIMMDTLKEKKNLIVKANQTISQLDSDLHTTQLTLAKEREGAADVVHRSTHISLLGIDFRKGVFIFLI